MRARGGAHVGKSAATLEDWRDPDARGCACARPQRSGLRDGIRNRANVVGSPGARGYRRTAVCRASQAAARPHAGGDRARPPPVYIANSCRGGRRETPPTPQERRFAGPSRCAMSSSIQCARVSADRPRKRAELQGRHQEKGGRWFPFTPARANTRAARHPAYLLERVGKALAGASSRDQKRWNSPRPEEPRSGRLERASDALHAFQDEVLPFI